MKILNYYRGVLKGELPSLLVDKNFDLDELDSRNLRAICF